MDTMWLPLSVMLLSRPQNGPMPTVTLLIYLMFSILCWGFACTYINDITDREQDAIAEKMRWIACLPPPFGLLLVFLIIGAGALVLVVTGSPLTALVAYCIAVFSGVFYSVRPLRFKERGIWGLFVYGLSSAIAYVFLPWLFLSEDVNLLMLLFSLVLIDKWVNLQFHQIADYPYDLNSRSLTYVVRTGIDRARRSLRFFSRLSSLWMSGVLFYIIFIIKLETMWRIIYLIGTVLTVASVTIYCTAKKKKSRTVPELVSELPGFYLSLTYLLFRMLPPFLFLKLAFSNGVIWMFVILSSLSLMMESLNTLRAFRIREKG